jgi:hypothetical protein
MVKIGHLDKRRRRFIQLWFRRRAVASMARVVGSSEEADAILRFTAPTRAAVVGSIALAALTVNVPITKFRLPRNINILIPRRYLRDWCFFLADRGFLAYGMSYAICDFYLSCYRCGPGVSRGIYATTASSFHIYQRDVRPLPVFVDPALTERVNSWL